MSKRKKTGFDIKQQAARIAAYYGENSTRGRFAQNTRADYEQNLLDMRPDAPALTALTDYEESKSAYVNKATPRVAKALAKIKANTSPEEYNKMWEGKKSARQVVASQGITVG